MKGWSPGDALPGAERACFLGEGTAVVIHAAAGGAPRASVVLAGPMALERSHAALTWVRLARTLALAGYEVYRFDYRGVGESLGPFEAQTFDGWFADLCTVLAHARGRLAAPVLVLGLRLGALLGRRALDEGLTEGLLALDPPTHGKAMLLEVLRRKLASDYLAPGGERRSREDYLRELEAGGQVEVEGYAWSSTLLQRAEGFSFAQPVPERCQVVWLDGRQAERLAARCASVRISKPVFWVQSHHLVADLGDLFELCCSHLARWQGPRSAAAPSSAGAGQGGRVFQTFDLEAGRCVGTVHVPVRRGSSLGVLWVNFGYAPRDGHGGLAAQASDAFASRGVTCFRFDLPGLGDAPGQLPAHARLFFPFVTGGGLTRVTSQLVRRLCQQHQLEGLVLAGLCGGAVNAIFTAEAEPALVKALILLEPELYLTEPGAEALTPEAPHLALAPGASVRRLRSKLFSYWGWMRLLTAENRYARFVPMPRKALLELVLGRGALPGVTNLPLVQAWQRWVRSGRSALVITAAGKLREVFFDRINRTVLPEFPGSTPACEQVRLTGTNHIFTTSGASAAVLASLERWWVTFTAREARRARSAS